MNIVTYVNSISWVTEDRARLLLRVVLGVVVLLHGIYKLQNPMAMDFVAGAFTTLGLPGALAYLIYIGEVVAPIMLIIGYQTKIAALLVAITMVVAILLVHSGQIFTLSEMGGGWAIELQMMLLTAAVAVFGLGGGRHVLIKK